MTYPIRPARFRNADRGKWIFPAVVLVTTVAAIGSALWAEPPGVWIFALVLGGWVITLCLHEFAHAAVALRGGDSSVRARGYLSLNPLKYTDVGMSLLIPLILLAIGGIPLPGGAVLIDHSRLKSRRWESLVSLAGPAVNILCGILLAAVAASIQSPLGLGLSYLALIQFVAAILNLLPVPGLDGYGIISPYLSAAAQRAIQPFRQWAPLLLFVILISIPDVAHLLWSAGYSLLEFFGGDARWANAGGFLFRFWQ